MLAVRNSIELVLFPQKFPDINLEQDIKHKIARLKSRIIEGFESGKEVDKLADELLSEVFNLRSSILQWITREEKGVNELLERTEKELDQLYTKDHDAFNEHICQAINLYKEISAPLPNTFGQTFAESHENEFREDNPATYYNFQLSLSLSGIPKSLEKGILFWTNASLKFELGLVIADLLVQKKLELSDNRQQEVAEFIYNQTERYAALSMIIGAWKPPETDDSQRMTNIRILASALELELGIGFSEELDKFVQSYENQLDDAQDRL